MTTVRIPPKPSPQKKHSAWYKFYNGKTHIDFVGKKRRWFGLSGVIIAAGIIAIAINGLNFGIDFKGGSSWEVLAPNVTISQVTTAVTDAGLANPTVQVLGGKTVSVQASFAGATPAQKEATSLKVITALARLARVSPNQVSQSTVGPTWGSEVSSRALIALLVFFLAVGIYISFRFEPNMALAAFIAMIHDLLVTVGVYAIAGFEITPDTVVAILTVLGYSLYDTVVVFDRVRDNTLNTPDMSQKEYEDVVNRSMNQTLARSINTSLVALLPVLAILVVGAYILGATTLQNYGLALFVGLLSGAYSSIFIAAPILTLLKKRERSTPQRPTPTTSA